MGDVVGHKEWSAEGKIDPAGIDMNDFRREVNSMVDQNKAGIPNTGGPVADNPLGVFTKAQDDALSALYNQTGRFHNVRQVFQKKFYNVVNGEMWTRAGLADIWNEVVWDGYVNPVDLLDKKVDPDNVPPNTPVENIARRGSLMSYVMGMYREATIARRNTDEILAILKKEAK